MSFLAEHYDPGLAVDVALTAAALGAQETARLRQDVSVMKAMKEIPRRLGGEATSEELAEDKRRARRVQHALMQCWGDWSGKRMIHFDKSEEVHREAASLSWETWWSTQQVYLLNRITYVVTWCTKTDQNDKGVRWTKSAVVRLQNEQRWLEYALR